MLTISLLLTDGDNTQLGVLLENKYINSCFPSMWANYATQSKE